MSFQNPFIIVGSRIVAVETVETLDRSRIQTQSMHTVDKSIASVGSTFQYFQCPSWPVVKNASKNGQPIISISRPSSVFVVNAVLRPLKDHLQKDGKYELSIIQEVLSNDEKRWYSETKTEKDFYVTTALDDGCSFPLLDRVTFPLDEVSPRENPCYSKYSMAEIDSKLLASGDDIYGTIYAFNEPLMNVRTALSYKDYEDVLQNHLNIPENGKLLLTCVEKLTRWRTWLVVRETTANSIYPLVALDWEFDFQLKTTSRNNDGTDLDWKFVNTPVSQALPVISLANVAGYRQLPPFPRSILTQKKSTGDFCIANDAFGWKVVLSSQ